MSCFDIEKNFAKNVFNDNAMQKYLPKNVYEKLKKTISEGEELDYTLAKVVASAILKWATENGATHFTHWFQPLNDSVAEKHDSFLRISKDKKPILEFSGKELIKGETDASSFPTGNLRATFEARGYTVWDCTSPAFLRKDNDSILLCIPTAFISYGGEALDNKTPLLRSMQVINNETIKLLKLFNVDVKKVNTMLGIEQEYFLVDKEKFFKRKDLIYCGRTLFGARTPKGQELDDHYSGAIKSRILNFMNEVNEELWTLGVPAKTQHNEVAPGQYELACIFEEANVSCDHNQIVMETLKKIAKKHDMVCILHEKPFKWVNGSGKHNNWSLITDTGINLLNPGDAPHENLQFLLILSCILSAVDKYAILLRASCATPGKEERLGSLEAPPAIVSCFVGEQLNDVIENFIDKGYADNSIIGKTIKKEINTLPELWLDATDRNRTSPFAFTGNKFEFRMVGSNDSCAMPIIVINTIVASEFREAYDILSNSKDFYADLKNFIKNNFAKHKKILFSGDGYSKTWEEEAEKRGLCNIKSIINAIPALIDENTINLFKKFNVLSENELRCRFEVAINNYINITNIEALTMIDVAKKYILPASINYTTKLASSINEINKVYATFDSSVQKELLKETLINIRNLKNHIDLLDKYVKEISNENDIVKKANKYKEIISEEMKKLRENADNLEMIVEKKMWPCPSYGDLLFELEN